MTVNLLGLCISTAGGQHFSESPWVVGLSYLIATVGSYTAIDMIDRLNNARPPWSYLWMIGSALALGGSVWSMHFVGILAVREALPMSFDRSLTAVSFLIVVFACGLGVAFVRGTEAPRLYALCGAGLTVGVGIVAMHYTGMEALRLPATLSYLPGRFCLSILIAIAAATVAFWVCHHAKLIWQRAVAAFVMGAAIWGMHYVAMAATVVHFSPIFLPQAGLDQGSLTGGVAGVTFALLALALVCGAGDRSKALAAQRETALLLTATREIGRRLRAAGGLRDGETGQHLLRIARISKRLAELAGQSASFVNLIEEAAPLHDIGKIGIPDEILLKSETLTEEEQLIMRSHTKLGHTLLTGSGMSLLDFAAEIALSHHEKWDGSGYPHGLSGDAIPLSSRIVAIADVFDALLSSRTYKNAWTPADVEAFLRREAGRHFDPRLVAVFLAHFSEMLAIRAAAHQEGVSATQSLSPIAPSDALTVRARHERSGNGSIAARLNPLD
jgi:HD-GYP domain-containing protein (c-di-GMP phosphodiesterase class II)